MRKIMLILLAILVITAISFLFHPLFGKLPSGERLQRILASPQYREGKFQNQSFTPDLKEGVTMWQVLKDFLFVSHPNTSPGRAVKSQHTDLKKWTAGDDVLVWMGHSSYFFQLDGATFLVDPVLTKNAAPLWFSNNAFEGADVFTPDDIPAIDYLIYTHDHYDHLDYTTFRRIKDRVGKIICPLGVGAHLEYWGYPKGQIIELDWWDSADLPIGKITVTPARHFSGRFVKRQQSLWCSYVLEAGSFKMYIGGDSGYDSHFREIGEKFGPLDLALIENGQYNYKWEYIHLLPHQVFQAIKDLNVKRYIPVHNSKFKLSVHSWTEPMDSLAQYAADEPLQAQMLTPFIGEVVRLKDTTQSFRYWWKE